MKIEQIQIPNGYELKQVSEGKWELVKSDKDLREILLSFNKDLDSRQISNRFIALSQLQCVADYLNDGWQPNWSLLTKEDKWCIEYIKNTGEFYVECWRNTTYGQVIFKTKELALQAIRICGEELLKVAYGVQK